LPRWSETIYLVSVTREQNEIGDTVDVETKRRVYASRKSVRQSEFYQAMSNGLRPELMFLISVFDYNNEKTIIYNDERYSVIRAYVTESDHMEIVCEGLTNRG